MKALVWTSKLKNGLKRLLIPVCLIIMAPSSAEEKRTSLFCPPENGYRCHSEEIARELRRRQMDPAPGDAFQRQQSQQHMQRFFELRELQRQQMESLQLIPRQ